MPVLPIQLMLHKDKIAFIRPCIHVCKTSSDNMPPRIGFPFIFNESIGSIVEDSGIRSLGWFVNNGVVSDVEL